MKRSTTRWTTAVAAAALLGLPAAGWAQTTTPTQPPAATAAQTDKQPAAAQEHLREAKTALNEIPATSVTGRARTQINELKRHLTALERASSTTAAPARGTAARGNANWGTEIAAMDKILAQLLDTTGTAGTGTTGTTGTTGATTPKSKATAVTIDEATRAKLTDVRTHITAYAAAMSGTTPAPDANEPTKGTDPAAATTATTDPATAATQPPTGTTPPTATQPPTGTTPTTSAQPPATTPAQPAAGAQDTEAMRRHLAEARDTLSQLTQLPAAAQLSGEARTQVSQLISNFNELITTQSNWTASYAKVAANLTSLLGPDNTDAEPTGGVPTTATGTTGAVGTSGTTTATLDPAVRAKLVDLRRNLKDFEKSAGGNIPSADPNAAAATGTMGTTGTPATTATPMTTGTPTTGTPTTSTPPTTTPATSTPATTTPTTSTPATAATPTTSTDEQSKAAGSMSKDDVMRHIEAMEAILGRDASTATSGTTGTAGSTAAKPSPTTKSLSAAEIDQLRMHLAELRKSIEKK